MNVILMNILCELGILIINSYLRITFSGKNSLNVFSIQSNVFFDLSSSLNLNTLLALIQTFSSLSYFLLIILKRLLFF